MYYRKENDINIKISNTEFTFIEPVLPEELNLNKEEILEFNKLKTYHMHTAYEIFFIEDSPITIVTPDGKSEFVNSIVILPPYYNHYTLNITQPKALLFNINNRENIKDEFNFLFESKVKNTAISVPINENISFYANQIFKNKG